MSTVLIPAEQHVVLHDVSWETYERILLDHINSSAPRFTFDHGELEIMTLSPERERYSRRLSDMIGVLADEFDLEIEDLGSTTFHRKDFERGFEPDSCYYFANLDRVQGRDGLDMTVDPPPDLVVEIDITSPSIGKFPIFAQFGVAEVWRFRDERLSILRLKAGQYEEVAESGLFRGVTAAWLSELPGRGKSLSRTAWLRFARAAVRESLGK